MKSSRLFNNNQLTLSAAFGFDVFFISQTTDNAAESVNVLYDEKREKSRYEFNYFLGWLWLFFEKLRFIYPMYAILKNETSSKCRYTKNGNDLLEKFIVYLQGKENYKQDAIRSTLIVKEKYSIKKHIENLTAVYNQFA